MSRGISVEEDYKKFLENLSLLLENSFSGCYDDTIDAARDWLCRNEPHLVHYNLKDHDVVYLAHTSSAVSLKERIDYVIRRMSRTTEYYYPGMRNPRNPLSRNPLFLPTRPLLRPRFVTPTIAQPSRESSFVSDRYLFSFGQPGTSVFRMSG